MWSYFTTGALAAQCWGRYRGRGRWVRGWVHWEDKDKPGQSMHGKADAQWVAHLKLDGWFGERFKKWEELTH